jgi:FkbM family methyltransferase
MIRWPMNNTIAPQQRFYSQHGEDVIAFKALHDSTGPRYFVEVGMIDGKRFSNTLALEEAGWTGLCVEAHPGYVELVRANRPRSVVVHAGAGDRSGVTLPFYAEPRSDLSGFAQRSEAQMRERFGHWFAGFNVINVPVRTLDDMLTEANAPRGLELVSIDVEGTELDVLRGLDLAHWQPRVLVVEGNDADARQRLDEYMQHHGYRNARQLVMNVFYTRDSRTARRLRLARVDQALHHTQHPIDPPGSHRTLPAPQTPRRGLSRVIERLLAA